MKRRLVMMLCLAAALSLFMACGKSSGSSSSSTVRQSSSISTSGGNWWDDFDFSKKVKLTYATTGFPNSGSVIAYEDAIRLIEARSRGMIMIELVYRGALGNEQSTFAQVMEGALDMAACGIGTVSQYTPHLEVFQLPFLINTYEVEAKALQLPEWKALVQKANEELRDCTIISMNEFGIREFATIDKPIKVMADIKGLKIRSIGNPVLDEALKIVGANPVNVTYTDLYSALQNKIVDGEEVNTTSVSVQKHYEVINYISEIGFYPFLSIGIMSNDVIKSLPDGYFDLIQVCFDEANRNYMQTTIYEWDKQGRQDCIDHGVKFNTIEDKNAWIEATLPLYERKAVENPLYASFIASVRALQ
jgi:TRAP-type C4-dicarboxylate transport system substrate-binding protein